MLHLAIVCAVVLALAWILASRGRVAGVEAFASATSKQWVLVSGARTEKPTMRLYRGRNPGRQYIEIAAPVGKWTAAHGKRGNYNEFKFSVKDPDHVRAVMVFDGSDGSDGSGGNTVFVDDGYDGEKTVSLDSADASKAVCAFGGRKIKQIVFHECNGQGCTAQEAGKRQSFTWNDLYDNDNFFVSAGSDENGTALQEGFSVYNRDAGSWRNTVQFVWFSAALESLMTA